MMFFLADRVRNIRTNKLYPVVKTFGLIVFLAVYIMMVHSCNKGDQISPEEEISEEENDQSWTESLQEIPENLEMIQTVTVGSNREIRINGDPFFPIMSWAQTRSGVYPMLKDLGINTHAGYSNVQAAKEAGNYCIADYKTSPPQNGSILALIYDDEPDMPQGQGANTVPRQPRGGS